MIRAVILAAGMGLRMRPLTEELPKPLLYAAGMTLLDRLLITLHSAGIEEFTIAVGWKGNTISQSLAEHPLCEHVKIVEVLGYEQGPLQSLIASFEATQDERFVLCPADFVVEPGIIRSTIKSHIEDPNQRLLTWAVDMSISDSTLIFLRNDGTIAGVNEPVLDSDYTARSAMLTVAERPFAKYCRMALKSGATISTVAANLAIAKGERLCYTNVEGNWFEVDRFVDLLEVNHYLLRQHSNANNKALFIHDGDSMEIGDSVKLPLDTYLGRGVNIIGPVLIEMGCNIGDRTSIGPNVSMEKDTSVGAGCSLKNCVIFGKSEISKSSSVDGVVIFRSKEYRSEE